MFLSFVHVVGTPGRLLLLGLLHLQIFKAIFSTDSLIHLFQKMENLNTHKNLTNYYSCQVQTNNPKWPIISKYEKHLYTGENSKFTFSFEQI